MMTGLPRPGWSLRRNRYCSEVFHHGAGYFARSALPFPRTTIDIADQQFRILVWVGELSGEPDYQMDFTPYYTDLFFDTLQGFSTYSLIDEEGNYTPLALPPGDFYVGWGQSTTCTFTNCIPIGYDKNRPQNKDLIFRNFGQGWQALPESTPGGSLMIRPVVGSETPGFTPVEEVENQAALIRLFPNPSRGLVRLDLPEFNFEDYQIAIFNQVGQLIRELPARPELNLSDLLRGSYFVRFFDEKRQQIATKKLILIN